MAKSTNQMPRRRKKIRCPRDAKKKAPLGERRQNIAVRLNKIISYISDNTVRCDILLFVLTRASRSAPKRSKNIASKRIKRSP
jgi:hypothetical protein